MTEARARRKRGQTVSAASGDTGADTWRANLQPRAAVRARTIPALERERDSLRARLAEVRFLVMLTLLHFSPTLNLCARLVFLIFSAINVDGEGKYGTLP